MKPGIYNPDDPDGEYGVKNMPDNWISIERNWIDTEYNDWQIKAEVVKYLDGSVIVNAVKFLSSVDEIDFIESVDRDGELDSSIDEKYNKMIKVLESQLC
jgi:hypothetical protein